MLTSALVSKAQREYIAGIFKIYQNKADFLKLVEEKFEEVPTNYRGRIISLETIPNPSLASGNIDGGDLATPSNETLENLTITYQWLNSGLEHSYGAMLNANKETVADPVKRSVKSSANQFSQWLNYYVSNGDGTTRLATTSAAYSGGTPTVLTCNGTTDSIGCSQLVKGQKVLVYDPTGTTQRVGTVGASAITIASKTGTTVTGTTNWPSDTASGDIIVPEGTNTTGIKGVPYIVKDTGAYFNGSRSSTEQLKSTVIPVGGALTAAYLLRGYAQTVQRAGRDEAEGNGWLTLACALTQWAAYFNLTTASPNMHYFAHTSEAPQIDVGGRSMNFTWFGAPIRRFFQFPGNKMFYLDLKAFELAVLKKPGQLLNMPAGDWIQAINGTTSNYKAARQMWMDAALDMYSPTPHVLGVLDTLDMTNLPMQKSA